MTDSTRTLRAVLVAFTVAFAVAFGASALPVDVIVVLGFAFGIAVGGAILYRARRSDRGGAE